MVCKLEIIFGLELDLSQKVKIVENYHFQSCSNLDTCSSGIEYRKLEFAAMRQDQISSL